MRGDGGCSHLENYISSADSARARDVGALRRLNQLALISINQLNLEQFLWLFNDGMSETPNELGENFKKVFALDH